MAKKLTAATSGKMDKLVGFSSDEYEQQLKELREIAPVKVPMQQIIRREPFSTLFRIDENTYERILDSMKKDGFDPGQPVVLFRQDADLVLLDGFTRYRAAEGAGLSEVYARVLPAMTDKQALAYAVHLQRDRRNLTDADILAFVLTVDPKTLPGSGKTRDKIAAAFGRSPMTIQKFLTIKDRANETQLRRVMEGEETASHTYDTLVGAPERVTVKKESLPPKQTTNSKAPVSPEPQEDEPEEDLDTTPAPQTFGVDSTPKPSRKPEPSKQKKAPKKHVTVEDVVLSLRANAPAEAIVKFSRGLHGLGRISDEELESIEERLEQEA